MAEKQPARDSRTRTDRHNHANDVQLAPMKKDGEALLDALNSAKMVAVLSGQEIMYVFLFRNEYQCFIHKLDAEEGRRKGWPVNERNTAMIKNLTSAADLLFEITPKPTMNPMGVMVAAERGIISYLDATGQLPAEDFDFMQWREPPDKETTKEDGESENL